LPGLQKVKDGATKINNLYKDRCFKDQVIKF
jgi:hypothetical protein